MRGLRRDRDRDHIHDRDLHLDLAHDLVSALAQSQGLDRAPTGSPARNLLPRVQDPHQGHAQGPTAHTKGRAQGRSPAPLGINDPAALRSLYFQFCL